MSPTRSGLFGIGLDTYWPQFPGLNGRHMEIIEVDELSALRREVTDVEIAARVAGILEVFDVQPDCPQAELARAARTSVALDRRVEIHDLGSLAYYYMGTGNPENEESISSIIIGNSLHDPGLPSVIPSG
jgi:L-arabinose isomerase